MKRLTASFNFVVIGTCISLFMDQASARPGDTEQAIRDQSDKELNAVYQQVIDSLSLSKQALLRTDERRWIKWRDIEAQRIAKEGGAVGGSAYRVDFLNAETKLIKERIEKVKRMREGSSSEKDEIGTQGSSHFVIVGIHLGDDADQVKVILDNLGMRNVGTPDIQYTEGPKSHRRVEYIKTMSFENVASGVKHAKLTLTMTPAFPAKETVASRVLGISYKTHFGEGVSPDAIKKDLINRYGNSLDQPGYQLRSGVDDAGRGRTVWFSADISPVREAGGMGDLDLSVQDNKLEEESMEKSKAYIDEQDAARTKDTTLPSY